MSVMDHDQQPRSGGMGRFLAIGAAAIAVLAAAYFGVTMMMTREAKPEPAPAARAEPAPAPPAATPAEPEKPAETPAARRPRPRKEEPPAPEPAAPPPAGPTLIVESDVPGASVFIDRKFVGTTPLRTTEVTGGPHQLNASVTGEEGLAQTIEIAGTGETAITLKFKDVRLDAAVAVVHKHGIGSCEGRLVATTDGLRYDTANKKDAFSIGFGQLESFEIDYLKKELKVKQKGGKSWNFTDKSDNADKLFVFHRDVTKAREKLAAQGK
ncbi:MAG: PEGA domain-containing protein [Vicinamibacterales bacterium]|jgi:hypothetical protein|nr:PEGA domain-containing protein [Vicinamibacterales bacterium]